MYSIRIFIRTHTHVCTRIHTPPTWGQTNQKVRIVMLFHEAAGNPVPIQMVGAEMKGSDTCTHTHTHERACATCRYKRSRTAITLHNYRYHQCSPTPIWGWAGENASENHMHTCSLIPASSYMPPRLLFIHAAGRGMQYIKDPYSNIFGISKQHYKSKYINKRHHSITPPPIRALYGLEGGEGGA